MENYLRPVTEKVDLKSLLDFLDVSIKYDFNNSTFILYDEQLEKVRADDIEIHDNLADFVLDNVSIFLDDYFLNDCNEELNKNFGTFEELLNYLSKNETEIDDKEYAIIDAIVHPEKIDIDYYKDMKNKINV